MAQIFLNMKLHHIISTKLDLLDNLNVILDKLPNNTFYSSQLDKNKIKNLLNASIITAHA